MRDSLGHMEEELIIQFTEESILRDYRIAFQSREASLLGRRKSLRARRSSASSVPARRSHRLLWRRLFARVTFAPATIGIRP